MDTMGAVHPGKTVLHCFRGSILEMDLDDLEMNFCVNTTALLFLARETIPAMLETGEGVILVTGNTSATRGKTNWGFFASTKAAVDENDTKQRELKWDHPLKRVAVTMFVAPIDG